MGLLEGLYVAGKVIAHVHKCNPLGNVVGGGCSDFGFAKVDDAQSLGRDDDVFWVEVLVVEAVGGDFGQEVMHFHPWIILGFDVMLGHVVALDVFQDHVLAAQFPVLDARVEARADAYGEEHVRELVFFFVVGDDLDDDLASLGKMHVGNVAQFVRVHQKDVWVVDGDDARGVADVFQDLGRRGTSALDAWGGGGGGARGASWRASGGAEDRHKGAPPFFGEHMWTHTRIGIVGISHGLDLLGFGGHDDV